MNHPQPITMSPPAASVPPSALRFWLLFGVIIVALLGGSYWLHRSLAKVAGVMEPALPVLAVTPANFTALERSGREVRWGDLRGKVVVCSSLYTVCPHGCAAVNVEMQKLRAKFGARPDFHLVSIAVAPERDTAPMLAGFAEAMKVKPADRWWFLTGAREPLWDFLTDGLKLEKPRLVPEAERLNPLDFYEHDLRIVLLDRAGRVRGLYAVFHPQPEIAELMCQRLQRDTQRLLDDPSLSIPTQLTP
jgi:cytochrome oxidase Cu insertion factor (SCO1/SenC/PrrC family)